VPNKRVLCPYHEEKTPSLVIYGKRFICYGCGKRGLSSDLGYANFEAHIPGDPEDLSKTTSYIVSLPKKHIRALWFHADSSGYYLMFPGTHYYKKRLYGGRVKYVSPSGHKKPLFVARESGDALVIVEGEINALSIASVCGNYAVCSPGGVGHFKSPEYVNMYTQFDNVLIICDKDGPGALAAGALWGLLMGRGKEAKTLLMEKDANQVLVEDGENALEKAIREKCG